MNQPPANLKATGSPEYWWAEEIDSGKIEPVELWKTTSEQFNDTIVTFGDAGLYDAKFWKPIKRIVLTDE